MKKTTQKEKCKMNTEEFIKNYNYKRRNVRHNIVDQLKMVTKGL